MYVMLQNSLIWFNWPWTRTDFASSGPFIVIVSLFASQALRSSEVVTATLQVNCNSLVIQQKKLLWQTKTTTARGVNILLAKAKANKSIYLQDIRLFVDHMCPLFHYTDKVRTHLGTVPFSLCSIRVHIAEINQTDTIWIKFIFQNFCAQ